eukprot:TRINITY_DN300_c0_g1_i1.p1 TRINITY_DN300_c0_g1~~TRINITY_DN300_c0_g1_i1.p1  ORF type:complete len:294 (-),score=85.50 TRINITY_DN300_c0_g1_i1:311-1192(-)
MLNELIRRCEVIHRESGDGKQKESKGEKQDEFSVLKKDIASQMREIRKKLNDRNELLEKGSNSRQTVELSGQIRAELKAVREDAQKLSAMSKALEKKKSKGKDADEEGKVRKYREEVVEVVFKHIDECEALERRRPGAGGSDRNTANRGKLLANATGFMGGSGSGGASSSKGGPSGSSSTPFDEASEQDLDAQLQVIEKKNEQIDKDLDEIAAGVQGLKHLALDMQDELKLQSNMIDEITDKVDNAQAHLTNLNKKLKQTIEKTRGADRFIIDFILICVLLGVGALIYNMMSK